MAPTTETILIMGTRRYMTRRMRPMDRLRFARTDTILTRLMHVRLTATGRRTISTTAFSSEPGLGLDTDLGRASGPISAASVISAGMADSKADGSMILPTAAE